MSRVILVVDDEPLMLDVTACMLEDLGCAVETAADAEQALKKIAADRRIEILITDINMPGMDGYALAQAAQRIRCGLSVIVLSGKETDGRGFPLVRKPFLPEDLKSTMARYTGPVRRVAVKAGTPGAFQSYSAARNLTLARGTKQRRGR